MTLSDFFYAAANTVYIWRPIAILLLCGVVFFAVIAILTELGIINDDRNR